jgi:outer membrane protein OmpA-like peptidoglycan-associated protein
MQNTIRTRAPLAVLLGFSLALSAAGCARMSKGQKAVAVGVGAGAAVGAVIGNNAGSTARGAIIGAAVGGTIGSIIGVQMDKQARELEQKIPGAVVERVGEGIQVTFASGLLFDFDSDHIRPEAADNLRNLAASLDKYPNTDLLIVGHTDAQGSDWYNDDLSQRRANSAASYLAARGVERGRLRASGRGEHEPVASNDDEAGRQKNRRVEVAIYASEEYRSELRSRSGGR